MPTMVADQPLAVQARKIGDAAASCVAGGGHEPARQHVLPGRFV
ncbi:hypothetical protein [Nonomuraea turkmeniaca]|nr:hypothetical protein [Nonomuraea turkmeniaca]